MTTSFPELTLSDPGSSAAPTLGHPLVDAYLEVVAARLRPNSTLAVAYDLKVFFTVIDVDPIEVRRRDVLAFIRVQRTGSRDATVVPIDGADGLALSTIRRRLSSLSGFYSHLVALGEMDHNPVQRGMPVRSPCADGTVPGTRSTTCDRCQGSGERITRRTEDCGQCAMGDRSDLFATSADATPCKACDDTGSVDIVDRRSCPACKGLGERHVSNPHSCQTCKGEATRPCDLCGATGRSVLATVAQIERWPPEGETVQAVTTDDAPASLSTSWNRVRLGSSSVRVRGDDVSTSTGSQAERKLVALGEDVTSFVDAKGRTEIGRSIELKQLLITWVLYSTAKGRTRAAVVLGRHRRVVLIDAVHRVRLGLLALLVVANIALAVAGFVSLR